MPHVCAWHAAARTPLLMRGAHSPARHWPLAVVLQAARQRIEVALDAAGIKPWELSSVDNSNCAGAPLDPGLMALA